MHQYVANFARYEKLCKDAETQEQAKEVKWCVDLVNDMARVRGLLCNDMKQSENP